MIDQPTIGADALKLGDQRIFLSTTVPTRRDWLLAAITALLSLCIFVVVVPFAKMQLPVIPAFIPTYESALLITDFLTAVLLLGQFSILRSRALLVLVGAYLFSGFMAIPHALTFPGVFSPTGLLGAGTQTTSWIYISWHIIFPLLVIVYALIKRPLHPILLEKPHTAIVTTIGMVCVSVIALTVITTVYEPYLPAILDGIHYTPTALYSLLFCGIATAASLIALWVRKPHNLLDVWMMVVMFSWLFDVGLSAAFNNGRYDLGFYAGRIYVLLGSSFVLAAICIEMTQLYTRLAGVARRVGSFNERIFETTHELVYVVDRTGNYIWVSPSCQDILGYTSDEMVGHSAADFIYPDDLDSTREQMRQARRDGHRRDFECRYVHKYGEVVPLQWTGVWSEAEQQHFFMGRDITAQRKIEDKLQKSNEALQQAQKMEAIGTLTGGIAHDFNNIAHVVMLNLESLQDELEPGSDAAQLCRDAMNATSSGADLIKRLLAFARRQPLKPEPTNVNDLIESISRLLKRIVGEDVEIIVDLGEDVWPVLIDPAQLESSITNLVTNARHAMPRGGHLTIKTSNVYLDEDYASLHIELLPGQYVAIEVSDTGTGIPQEIQPRIFEPFFTTKETGTGLGLSMVFGFLKQSGGHINVYSEVGIGTTFRLYLPRLLLDAVTTTPTVTKEISLGSGQIILVVEDRDDLRQTVVRQLTELGYNALDAANAKIAFEMLQNKNIDLLFTDVVMPGMNGYELARHVHEQWPNVKILLTSGFPQTKGSILSEMTNGFQLLNKPYSRRDLASAIWGALST